MAIGLVNAQQTKWNAMAKLTVNVAKVKLKKLVLLTLLHAKTKLKAKLVAKTNINQ
jgi:hypothetical protein